MRLSVKHRSVAPLLIAAGFAVLMGTASGAAEGEAPLLRLNDITAVGTHNSYKEAMPAATLERIRALNPAWADALDYSHRPLAEQLAAGARQLEIDVNYDPQGGHYAAGSDDPKLKQPGFKVLHIPGIDNASNCVMLTDCLRAIRSWSDAHPHHVPILLLFNAKDERNAARGGVDALPFDAAAYDALDAEIRSVMTPEKLVTPDDVQGDYPTLREAVLANNWPALDAARGRFIFALDESPAKVAIYRGSRASLEGRVFFINTDAASPAAAYMTLNDPVGDADRIRQAVAAGYLVRTRADADTREARLGDVSRRDAALASGAQYISTDYLWADERFAGGYQVRLPGGVPAGCNPVRRPARCEDPEPAG